MKPTPNVIISCAITGSIHTPSMSPYLPVTPDEIARSAIEASKAGAAIVHLHVRRPEDGYPVQDVGLFREVVTQIREGCDAIINLTTGGASFMTIDERLEPAVQIQPELASLNMGSISINLSPMLRRDREFRFEWERRYLEDSAGMVFKNSFKDIEHILRRCSDHGTRFEFECYDIGHLYNLAYFVERQIIKPPFFVQSVFGLLGGIGAHPEDVAHMYRTAQRLFGSDLVWSVLGAGKGQMRLAAFSALNGGNVRVGLEDSLWVGPGRLAESNAAQVTQVRGLLDGLALPIASPQQARERLALKGADTLAI
ncbi:3-keto-5-aminohexanoate cleavage protein [Paraburkholderia sp. J12]|uniref:3-keto-5-aminohexanoate cleavage protein n=1 Tax=Paraburkholderia sp. J12 TaxID=2805432 RepID=UPI002ABDAA89|nr:3-keto-5-aminohexanoate cleavage protein [Paraburkholderia sp. J12]